MEFSKWSRGLNRLTTCNMERRFILNSLRHNERLPNFADWFPFK